MLQSVSWSPGQQNTESAMEMQKGPWAHSTENVVRVRRYPHHPPCPHPFSRTRSQKARANHPDSLCVTASLGHYEKDTGCQLLVSDALPGHLHVSFCETKTHLWVSTTANSLDCEDSWDYVSSTIVEHPTCAMWLLITLSNNTYYVYSLVPGLVLGGLTESLVQSVEPGRGRTSSHLTGEKIDGLQMGCTAPPPPQLPGHCRHGCLTFRELPLPAAPSPDWQSRSKDLATTGLCGDTSLMLQLQSSTQSPRAAGSKTLLPPSVQGALKGTPWKPPQGISSFPEHSCGTQWGWCLENSTLFTVLWGNRQRLSPHLPGSWTLPVILTAPPLLSSCP